MQRWSKSDGMEPIQRSQSVLSERNLKSASPSTTSLPPVSPDPAFIAASAASQIVTSDRQSQIDDWFDNRGGKIDAETVVVSPAALVLVNNFLDQLLYNVLATARSTAIASLRPAVSEVLKPRLAQDAIDSANEELQEFLGSSEVDERLGRTGPGPRGKWDLTFVWRRTRLRCMVYTRLGDMEEEDEEIYILQEQMEDVDAKDHPISLELDVISPAAAIFLTSIIEFIGEHALRVAGEAASNRMEIKQTRGAGGDPSLDPVGDSRMVVEEIDVEKLAFNTTLGRLWRSWKKRVRAPSTSSSRPISRELMRRRAASTSGSPSLSEADDPLFTATDSVQRPSVEEVLEEEHELTVTEVPLEGPGEARQPTLNSVPEPIRISMNINGTTFKNVSRPHSMLVYPRPSTDPSSSLTVRDTQPNGQQLGGHRQGHTQGRKRSTSLPSPEPKPYVSPVNETFATPMGSPGTVAKAPEPQSSAEVKPHSPQDHSTLLAAEDDTVSGEDGNLSHTGANDVDLGTLSGFTGPQSSYRLSCNEKVPSELEAFELPRRQDARVDDSSKQRATRGEPIRLERITSKPVAAAAGHDKSQERVPLESLPPQTEKVNANSISREGPPTLGDGSGSDHARKNQPPIYSDWTLRRPGKEGKKQLQSLNDVSPPSIIMVHGQQPSLAPASQTDRLGDFKQKATFNAAAASIPRSEPASSNSTSASKQPDLTSTPPKSVGQTSGLENGAPSLTPLRELMEGAHDTSDDSSSFNPSLDASQIENASARNPSQKRHGSPNLNSPSGSTFSSPKPSGRARLPDLRKELPALNTSGAERAAVQRVGPAATLVREVSVPPARTSTSSSREIRPHTSTSGSSQLSHKIKGLIGRESTDNPMQPTATRNSSVDSQSTANSGESKTPRPLTKQQSFEQLMRSEETIQYTLTPKNMRDIEVCDLGATSACLTPKTK